MNCAAVNITANIAPADHPLPTVSESVLQTVTTVSDSTTTSTRVFLTSTTTTITITVDHKQQSTSTLATSDVVPNKGKKPCHSAAIPSTSASRVVASSTEAAAPEATEGSPQLFQTANGCSCTCLTPTNITTCNCYCNQQSGRPNPADHRLHSHNHIRERDDSIAAPPESKQPQWVPFKERPLMFIADDGNGCLTPHTTAELKYPDPGPNVQIGDGEYPLELPYGNCTGAGPKFSRRRGST